MYKKWFSILMVVVIMMGFFTVCPFTVNAQEVDIAKDGANVELAETGITQSEFNSRLNNLREQYPNYSTWYDSFDGGIQCFGFARLVAYNVFYSHVYDWEISYSMDGVKAGDVIQYGNTSGNGHTIFVLSVSGSTIKYVDCNGNGGYCKVRWDDSVTIGTKIFGLYSFNYRHVSPNIDPGPSFTPVDLGTDFYAIILNSHYWKPIENNNYNVVLGTENHTRKQLWKFERQNDLSYKIISLFDNEVIDLNNYGSANGTNIGMCVSTDSSAQRWYITNNNGAYCFIPKCSPNGAMDINNNDSTDGTNIHYWAYHGKDSQTFSIYRIDDIAQYLSVDIGSNFTALILNSHYWKPIENRDHNVVLSTEDYSKKQLWRFERQSDKSYKIISLLDDEVIDLKDLGNANGTNIGMCVSTDSSAQRWYMTYNNGAYCLIPKCSQDGAMDINNNDSADGTNIHYWYFHGKDSQTFSIYKINDVNLYLNSHTDPTSIPTETTEFLGDVDGDGEVTIIDATAIQRHLASIPTASYNEKAADADEDGELSILDATAIQRWLAQLPSNENIGKPIA